MDTDDIVLFDRDTYVRYLLELTRLKPFADKAVLSVVINNHPICPEIMQIIKYKNGTYKYVHYAPDTHNIISRYDITEDIEYDIVKGKNYHLTDCVPYIPPLPQGQYARIELYYRLEPVIIAG